MENSTSHGNVTSTMRQDSTLLAGLITFFAALNIFLSVTACLSNALILIALHKVSSVYPSTKLLFRCLAVTDLCVGLVVQPLLAVLCLLTTVPKVFKYVNDALNATSLILCGVSILTSTAISVDRLLTLLLGLRYRHAVTVNRVRVVITCFWLTGFLAVLLYFFVSVLISMSLAAVLAIVSIVVSISSYTEIFLKLKHQQTQFLNHAHQGQPNRGGIPLNIARYKKSVSTIAWVQLALVVFYLPYIIFFMLGYSVERHGVGEVFAWYFSVTLVYFNSSLNPVLYCWKIKEVRQVVKDTVKQFCCSSC